MDTKSRYAAQLDAKDCALVLVDFLNGFRPGLRTVDWETFQHNVTSFASLSKIFAMPTFVLGDEGGFRGDFFPQLKALVPDAPRFGRHTPSALRSGGLRDALKKSGKTKVILGGISLDNCTMLTALDMLAEGYEVYVVVDVSGTESTLVETASMMRLVQAGAVLTGWVMLASELMKDWETPAGPQVGALYAKHSAWGGEVGGSGAITESDVHRWIDAWNSHDLARIGDLLADDAVMHQPQNPKPLTKSDVQRFFGGLFGTYPDIHFELSEAPTISGMHVASWERVTGTMTGAFHDPASGRSVPPTGKSFDIPGAMHLIYRPTGKLKSVRIYWDRMLFSQQLGLL